LLDNVLLAAFYFRQFGDRSRLHSLAPKSHAPNKEKPRLERPPRLPATGPALLPHRVHRAGQ
jgi:hypothetical protein